MQKMQKFLTELRSRAVALSDRRMAAETALAEATAQRDKYMLTGDLADEQTVEKLQTGVDSCQSRFVALPPLSRRCSRRSPRSN